MIRICHYMERSIAKSLAEWSHTILTHFHEGDATECLAIALKYPEENWNWFKLTRNFDLTVEIVREHIHRPWNWEWLSHRKYFPLVEEFPEKEWNWHALCIDLDKYMHYSEENQIPIEFIIKHVDKPWKWNRLMYIPHINFFKIMDECPNSGIGNWNWRALSGNNHVTIEILRKYIDKPWCFNELSYSSTLSLEMVRLLPEADWEWWGVSSSPKIHLEEILANPDLPWHWGGVSANPNVGYETAQMYPDKEWDWSRFLSKEGGVSSFIDYKRRSYAASIIQKYWRICVSDPKYKVCQRRLEWEWGQGMMV